ncbi:MAG: radical SAM protein [Pirellulales bacterium]
MQNDSAEPINLSKGKQPQVVQSACESQASIRSPLVVVVRVTNECSLRCRFCGFSNELSLPKKQIDWPSLQRLGIWLRTVGLQSRRNVLVSWLGGEPFKWPNWLEASHYFARQLNLSLSVTTNGLALDKEHVRQQALSLFQQITISVDGLAEFHDNLRQVVGMFEKLKKIVGKINQSPMRQSVLLRINAVLTRENIDSFPAFCDVMADWGFDELTFNPLGGNDRPEFFPANRLSAEQVERFINSLEEVRCNCQSKGLNIRGNKAYIARLLATARREKISWDDCNPGEHFLFVDENCRLSPCSFTTQHFGQVENQPALDLELSGLIQQFKSVRRERCPAACEDCHANHIYAKFG